MTLQVYVQNHHSRSADPIVTAITAAGEVPTVITDTTDHYRERGHRRMRGNFFNYLRLLQTGLASGADWIVTIQDDVAVVPTLFQNIRHVAAQTVPTVGLLSFYVPQNGLFVQARQEGYRVVESFHNFAILCLAISRRELEHLVPWLERHVARAWEEVGDGSADDDAMSVYCSYTRRPVRTIVPSLVQHLGATRSTFKTAGVVAGRPRESACYTPDYDATTVNWRLAFATPLVDGSRITPGDLRFQRTRGLFGMRTQ